MSHFFVSEHVLRESYHDRTPHRTTSTMIERACLERGCEWERCEGLVWRCLRHPWILHLCGSDHHHHQALLLSGLCAVSGIGVVSPLSPNKGKKKQHEDDDEEDEKKSVSWMKMNDRGELEFTRCLGVPEEVVLGCRQSFHKAAFADFLGMPEWRDQNPELFNSIAQRVWVYAVCKFITMARNMVQAYPKMMAYKDKLLARCRRITRDRVLRSMNMPGDPAFDMAAPSTLHEEYGQVAKLVVENLCAPSNNLKFDDGFGYLPVRNYHTIPTISDVRKRVWREYC